MGGQSSQIAADPPAGPPALYGSGTIPAGCYYPSHRGSSRRWDGVPVSFSNPWTSKASWPDSYARLRSFYGIDVHNNEAVVRGVRVRIFVDEDTVVWAVPTTQASFVQKELRALRRAAGVAPADENVDVGDLPTTEGDWRTFAIKAQIEANLLASKWRKENAAKQYEDARRILESGAQYDRLYALRANEAEQIMEKEKAAELRSARLLKAEGHTSELCEAVLREAALREAERERKRAERERAERERERAEREREQAEQAEREREQAERYLERKRKHAERERERAERAERRSDADQSTEQITFLLPFEDAVANVYLLPFEDESTVDQSVNDISIAGGDPNACFLLEME